MIKLWGKNHGTVRDVTEAGDKKVVFYTIIYLVKGKHFFVCWL